MHYFKEHEKNQENMTPLMDLNNLPFTNPKDMDGDILLSSSIIPNFQISQDSVGNSNRSETSTSDNTETYQENTSSSGHPTFKCPLCQESNFTRQRLLDHCNSNHLFQIVPVTCPICVSLPWGDPSQITRNFVSHLNQRHQFDYGEFVNLQLDEETQYQTAVEESFQVNI
ncbi:E3 ubiquitin-protein ligase RNF138-like [Meles meles]|uniref:E3 ubiquitin-protein ligase RNF138-like n=1 Tax=Meles meles TaxID=9662 RepID=UPI001E69E37E|nr:E3 ubiquitin-protein ligase RNF138-like [Meles meles]